ncbi:Gfo/Idh/MocA family protein [Dyadobacter sandarakinus]|uniref:Gfo/Idh/MocA family oxidoreductase n=1 Tax=Dyadobacter sandarakinus TaxID=2747268 RepID=A0ABX7I1P2_9BACT|nr:Gfo/Idh/MocA family oxidoreductase [Dyadobacter sandarakinus]QRR00001.1 Gfo/Idh/MocA family oxidoreductase [Dyadobacter sandarakinus]
MDRRDFIHKAALAGSATAIIPDLFLFDQKTGQRIRLGLAGAGEYGRTLLSNALLHQDVEVTAICDIHPGALAAAARQIREAGKAAPALYRNEEDFISIASRNDVDALIIATPDRWHIPMALAGMQAGKYVAAPISGIASLEQCWSLVDTFERTGAHLMVLDNASFRSDLMAVLGMVRSGSFGKMTYVHCGFRNESYPQHGLGPVSQWLDINRGNNFAYLIATGPAASPDAVISCYDETSIILNHEEIAGKPLTYRAQGTAGIWNSAAGSIYLEGVSNQYTPESDGLHLEKHRHPLWNKWSGAHAQADADYAMMSSFIACVRTSSAPQLDVYDAAAWNAIKPLSQRSASLGGAPVEIPDFTRGKWQTNRRIFGLHA